MYVWIWRHLPGPFAVRCALSSLLIAGVAALLFMFVFPEVESLLPYMDVTVDPGPTPGPS